MSGGWCVGEEEGMGGECERGLLQQRSGKTDTDRLSPTCTSHVPRRFAHSVRQGPCARTRQQLAVGGETWEGELLFGGGVSQ